MTTLEGYVELVMVLLLSGQRQHYEELLGLVRKANSFSKEDADFSCGPLVRRLVPAVVSPGDGVTPWDAGSQWRTDSERGFLGRKPPSRPGGTPQPLHKDVRVDIEEALRVSAPALLVWRAQAAAPHAPLYSGGILDSWPAWVVEVLQWRARGGALKAFLLWESTAKGRR